MKNKDFLLEVGCEEIPACFMEMGLRQLEDYIKEWLEKNRITYSHTRTFGTPRRLCVFVSGVNEQQEDMKEEVKGPPIRIAKDAQGCWSKAAKGFAKKLGISVDQLEEKEMKGEKYVIASIYHKGQKTMEVMKDSLNTVLDQIQFPKSMVWNESIRFIRPVRWILCLFGTSIVPIQWAGVTSSKWTYGHRFLGGKVVVPSSDQYTDTLKEEYVIVDSKERKKMITDQLACLAKEKNWIIPVDQDLLEEVTYLVEYPTALFGEYDKAFLSLPKEVLITTMREHQRYFPVMNEKNELLPFFVTVRNGNSRSLDAIAKGNEKVLRARLSDARFFYDEDLKWSIAELSEKLSRIMYMKNVGSMTEKVNRIQKNACRISKELSLEKELMERINRAAEISKFSLATYMVNEFPELEGTMSREYAKHNKELEEVQQALYEYHLPRFSNDDLPKGTIGTVLSLSDKIDTIICSFYAGIKPTSSQDPYGLRRKANGIVKILMQEPVLPLTQVIQIGIDGLDKIDDSKDALTKDLQGFFTKRLQTLLQEESIRYDVIDAVLSTGINEPYWILKKANLLTKKLEDDSFKKEIEAFSRVMNLANKATDTSLHRDLLSEACEYALLRVFEEAKVKYEVAIENEDVLQMYKALTHMVSEINHFFEHVMVMVDDEKVRNNRLALLKEISSFIHRFVSFDKIVFA